MSNAMQVDESKLNAFIGQMLSDLGGASSIAHGADGRCAWACTRRCTPRAR